MPNLCCAVCIRRSTYTYLWLAVRFSPAGATGPRCLDLRWGRRLAGISEMCFIWLLSRELFVQPDLTPLMAWRSTSHLCPSGSSKALNHCPSEDVQWRCDQGSATLKGPYRDQQPWDTTRNSPGFMQVLQWTKLHHMCMVRRGKAFKQRCTWANTNILRIYRSSLLNFMSM